MLKNKILWLRDIQHLDFQHSGHSSQWTFNIVDIQHYWTFNISLISKFQDNRITELLKLQLFKNSSPLCVLQRFGFFPPGIVARASLCVCFSLRHVMFNDEVHIIYDIYYAIPAWGEQGRRLPLDRRYREILRKPSQQKL